MHNLNNHSTTAEYSLTKSGDPGSDDVCRFKNAFKCPALIGQEVFH